LTNEAGSTRVKDWIERPVQQRFLISEWVVTEFAAALSVKIRAGEITPTYRASARVLFDKMTVESLTTLTVSSRHFGLAADFADRHATGLRAADALHLAIASVSGATLYTLDRRLAAAGAQLNVATRLL
jgi:predicted nucleic acid-binding protein